MGQIYSIEEIRNILAPIFARYDVKHAILFGSYANNSATDKSDIDLLVDSGLRGMQFIELYEELHFKI